jgi:hypothetical protein
MDIGPLELVYLLGTAEDERRRLRPLLGHDLLLILVSLLVLQHQPLHQLQGRSLPLQSLGVENRSLSATLHLLPSNPSNLKKAVSHKSPLDPPRNFYPPLDARMVRPLGKGGHSTPWVDLHQSSTGSSLGVSLPTFSFKCRSTTECLGVSSSLEPGSLFQVQL